MREEAQYMSGFKVPCSTKLYLLKEYVASMGLHNKDVREYAEFVTTGVDGDLMAVVKRRMEESLNHVRDSRRWYTDHMNEHGCEVHVEKPDVTQASRPEAVAPR
jgi:hypothetical protein